MASLRILVFGAHPDDAELNAGGCAALWTQQGHQVKFVSTTNGDVGHAFKSGPALATLRKQEVEAAARILGIETEVLDIHDGQLMPTLENRLHFLKLIREWKADIVIGHRPFDYHPDHRYTGILMQDAAFMVTVRNYYPEVPCLKQNPVFLYSHDNFQTPLPFTPSIVVPIDSVIEQKMDALWCLESQIESLWSVGNFMEIRAVPSEPTERAKRKQAFSDQFKPQWRALADQHRTVLSACYGQEVAAKTQFAESFQICEYGRQPTSAELIGLFPRVSV
jgi:LmbE family N-acetylglucosaminyl deacetylase